MAVHDVTANLSATAGVGNMPLTQKSHGVDYVFLNVGTPSNTPTTNAGYEYFYFSVNAVNDNVNGGEFIYGEINNYLLAYASLVVEASVASVFFSGYGTAVDTATSSLAIPYPANTAANDLILALTAGKNEYYFPYSTTFHRGVLTWNSFSANTNDYQYYSDPHGVDTGRMNANVFQRILTEGQSGTIDLVLPTPSTDYVHLGRALRLTKSSGKEWNVQHFNCAEHYASTYWGERTSSMMSRTHPFLQTTATQVSITAVGWDGKWGWVCGSSTGQLARSVNGSVWTPATTNPFTSSDSIRMFEYGAGKFICTTSNNKMAWSTDGTVWTSITSPFSGGADIELTYNGTYFFASNGTQVARSTDGLTWTLKNPGSSASLTRPVYGNGTWVVSESTDTATHYFWYSFDDGDTWTRKSLGDNNSSIYLGARTLYGNAYNTRPDGTPVWSWVGGYAFGYISTSNLVDGPFYYDTGDYQSPFSYYDSTSGGTNYYSVSDISSDGGTNAVTPSMSGPIWRGYSDNARNYMYWTGFASHSGNNSSYVEGHYGVNGFYPKKSRDQWMIPYGMNGLITGSILQIDIIPGDLLIFQLATTYDYAVSLTNIGVSGLTLGPITWLPTYTTTTGGDAAQYIGYAYVVSGTASQNSAFILEFNTDKSNDRSSAFSLTRIRAESIPNEIKATALLSASGIIKKTECVASASMLVDAYVEAAPTYAGVITYTYEEVSDTSLQITFTTPLDANTLLVLTYTSDNYSGTLPTITVSDTFGAGTGSWVVHDYARQGSSAAAGVTTAIAAKYLTTSTTGSHTITVTLSHAVKAKGFGVTRYKNVYNIATTANAVGTSTTPSASLSAATQSVVVGVVGWENNGTYSSNATGWTGLQSFVTGSGGNAATHISHLSSYKITSSAGTQTYNPTLGGSWDWAEVVVEFKSGHKVGSIMRVVPTLSADASVLEAKRATHATYVTASLVTTDEHVPAAGEVITGHIDSELTGTAIIEQNATVTLEATVSAVATGNVPQTHNAAVMDMSTSVSLQAVSPILATVMDMVATANTMLTPVIDIDTPPVIVTPPPPLEGDETWGSASGEEPPFGDLPPNSGFGNIIEITNRTYSDLYETQRRYRNNDEEELVPYQMQAAQGKVANIGGGRALCMHIQENSWYFSKFTNAPAMLVATVINAGAAKNPAVISQRRYELPLHMRGFATTDSTICELPDGGVIYTVTGMVFEDFTDFSNNINLDEGDIARDGSWVPGPLTIAARIDVDGAGYITYTWVKRWGVVGDFNPALEHGGPWSGIHWGLLYILDGYPIYQTIAAYMVHFLKIDPATGAWIEVSEARETTGQFSVAITDGTNVTLLHEDYANGRTFYTSGSLEPLSIDPIIEPINNGEVNNITYNGRHLVASLYRLGWYPNSYTTIGWLGNTTTAEFDNSRCEARLFEWSWDEDGVPYVKTVYMADNVLSDDLRGPGHGNLYADYVDRWYENYSVAEDDVTPWVYYYGGNSDTSSTNWLTAVQTDTTYSYVYLTNELANINAEPRRSMGVNCTYKLEAVDDDGKAVAWYTPPVGNSTWDSYFWKTRYYPWSYSWYCNTHAQTMSNGNIVVLLTATNNKFTYTALADDWADQWENGETRAFVCIVEGGEPPPLKMTQRDDGRRGGTPRIAYIPVNGDSQRIASETY